jgi:hypothetical protein
VLLKNLIPEYIYGDISVLETKNIFQEISGQKKNNYQYFRDSNACSKAATKFKCPKA